MRIYTKVVIDMRSLETLHEEYFEYYGEIAECKKDSGGDQEITVRYAGYIESKHQDFLSAMQSYRVSIADDSPFADWSDLTIDPAFFGTGYLISSFPSLYDMYGKFMAGLDVDALHGQIFEDTVNGPEVTNLVSAEASLLDDDIDENVIPRFELGMRDANATRTSSFVIGKALIESARVKSVAKFDAELRYRLIPVAQSHWAKHLDWNTQVILKYMEAIKLYYSVAMDVNDFNYEMATKDKLWPFTVMDFERAGLGALQGATTTKTTAGASVAQRAISGALTGMAVGAQVATAIESISATQGIMGGGFLGLAAALL